MAAHVCPWWGGYFIDNRLRRWFHNPERILAPLVRAGLTALDFGCGMGLFSIALAKLVGETGHVISADLQPQMLDVLQRRAQRAGVAGRIRTHRCEAERLGLSDPVDFALAFYSAHEVPDLGRLLAEIHAGLRPAGQFLVVEPKGHVPAKDFARMISLAQQLGFQDSAGPHVFLSRAVVFTKA